jgi:hypothetical protein
MGAYLRCKLSTSSFRYGKRDREWFSEGQKEREFIVGQRLVPVVTVSETPPNPNCEVYILRLPLSRTGKLYLALARSLRSNFK